MSCGSCDVKCSDKSGEKEEKLGKTIGTIEHFYSKLGVGIIKLSNTLKVGDKIKIKGHTTDIKMDVDQIQVDHKDVDEAKKGDIVGVKVGDKVREDDKVYKA